MVSKTYSAINDANLSVKPTGKIHIIFNLYSRLWTIVVLVLADMVSLSAAILVAFQLRRTPGWLGEPAYKEFFLLLALALVLGFARKGLYPGLGLTRVEELQQIVSSASFTFLIMVGFTYVLKTSATFSRLALIYTWVLSLAFVPFGRYLMRHLLIRLQLWGEPVAIIGDPLQALPLARYFRRKPWLGIRSVVVMRDEHCSTDDFKAYPPLTVDMVKDYARSLALKTVLILCDNLNGMDDVVDRYRYVFQRVILIKYKNGRYGLNTLRTLDFSDVLGLQVQHNLLSLGSQVTKRTFDIVGSFFGLIFAAPFLGLIAILIKIDSPGKVFYFSPRLGKGGRVYNMLKFRTMYSNADEILNEELANKPELKKEWDQFQKLKNDPRMSRFGAFLRKYSLDELPQLWNVLVGEMSLVGPRPIMPFQREKYGEPVKDYMRVLPGLTGLWQVSGRNNTNYTRHIELDMEYIQRWSIWLDIYILLATIRVVLSRDGAY
jgi:Undecaprenyl-phosphate galactose phosphotransferase WbaP